MPAKSHQISVRLLRETDAWLERRAGGHVNKADFIRRLIEKEMEKEREENLLEMFNKAAADLTEGDHAEREELLGAFHANEEQARSKRKGGR